MKRYVFLDVPPYNRVLRVEEAEPKCGVDFCDRCGDCLSCDSEGPCYGGSETHEEHYWVEYEKPTPPTPPPTTGE